MQRGMEIEAIPIQYSPLKEIISEAFQAFEQDPIKQHLILPRQKHLLKLRNYKTQVKELGRNDSRIGHISEMEITICGRRSRFTGNILVIGDM